MKLVFLKAVFFGFFLVCLNACNQSEETTKTPEISYSEYVLKNPSKIGDYNQIEVFEGGYSGLQYIPNTNYEFYAINDRGPNVPIKNEKLGKGKVVKFFPFPDYNQKLVRLKTDGDELKVVSEITLNYKGEPIVGLPIKNYLPTHQEIPWSDTSGTVLPFVRFGFDLEGITLQNDSTAWLVDEYRPSILKVNLNTGEVKNIYSPITDDSSFIKLPEELKYRRPNRAFEGVAFSNGFVYAMLQSPMWHPSKAVQDSSKVNRIIRVDTKTSEVATLLYPMNNQVRKVSIKDWKIGDMSAINKHAFLVLEHGSKKTDTFIKIYLVNTKNATPLMAEPKGDKKLEQYFDNTILTQEQNIHFAEKKLLLDLSSIEDLKAYGKPEGLTIINDSTIALIFDNDYGIDSFDKPIAAPLLTRLFVFNLNTKLQLE